MNIRNVNYVGLCVDLEEEYKEFQEFYKYYSMEFDYRPVRVWKTYLKYRNRITVIGETKYKMPYKYIDVFHKRKIYPLRKSSDYLPIRNLSSFSFHNMNILHDGTQEAAFNSFHAKYYCCQGEYHNRTTINGVLQPAIAYKNGDAEYYNHGVRDNSVRINGVLQPAVINNTRSFQVHEILTDRTRFDRVWPLYGIRGNIRLYYIDGVLTNDTRIDGVLRPAIVSDNLVEWRINNILHNDTRINGILQPAAIHGTCCSKIRKVIVDSWCCHKEWRINGVLHNDTLINGIKQPAITGPRVEYYTNGVLDNSTVINGMLQPALIIRDKPFNHNYYYIQGRHISKYTVYKNYLLYKLRNIIQ